MVRERVRIRFCKQGDLRLIGHRDLLRTLERLFRRAGLKLGMSQGFHPKPRMSFPLALAVGIEGLDEVMELELAKSYTADELHERLARHTLPGLEFRSVEVLEPSSSKARVRSVVYQVPIPPARRADAAGRAARLMADSSCTVERPEKGTSIDVRPFLEELTFEDDVLRLRLAVVDGRPNAQPRDVLRAIGLDDLAQSGVHVTRTRVEIE